MSDSLSPTKRALLALKQMQSKLTEIDEAKHEPIAIVGMGCRFPGGINNPDQFWQKLRDGVDTITEVPRNRWNIDHYYDSNPETPGKICTRYGGFISHIQEFDAQFFRIAPREANSLDPQQRLLLEVSWEALENAGIAADRLIGSQTGVFIGISSTDYWHQLLTKDVTEIDAYLTTGNTHSLASGRLSYLFGLTGPSLSVDTACSSSLVAVHLATTSLRNQECDLALVGGVNCLLSPKISINFSKARMLSPDGRCKTFDADANGFVRSEGCGVIILKRLRDALNSNDNILALIRGSAVNQDGRTSSITVPNSISQQSVINQALKNSRVDPSEINYIETHGTGTSLGDPIEVSALSEVFSKNRPPDEPLIMGAVKTNIGHLEAAAGIASLIKVVLALQHEKIPSNLHFHTPNPYINWEKMPLKVPMESIPWVRQEKQRYCGINSFGFSGTNAHVVLAEAPRQEMRSKFLDRPSHIFTLAAKTEKALQDLVQNYLTFLESYPSQSIADICFTANTGRSGSLNSNYSSGQLDYRLAILASSTLELQEKLLKLTNKNTITDGFLGRLPRIHQPKITFLFAGEGVEYVNMGRQLYESLPIFRRILDQCNEILQPYLNKPLLQVLYPKSDGHNHNLDSYAPIALFVLEYALAQVWISWGIEPTFVRGYGLGEYVAACIAGVFNLEDCLLLIVNASFPHLNLKKIVEDIKYSTPEIEFISPVSQKAISSEITIPDYWNDLTKKSTKLKEKIQPLIEAEAEIFIEISPKSKLSATKYQGVWLSSLNPEQEWENLLKNIYKLYTKGLIIDWVGFDQDYPRCKVVLPTYPFQRQRYWIETNI